MDIKDPKVKGTVLLDYVRMIRANKDKNWDKHLKKEDWKIINGMVLAAVWYPFETFFRCGKAVFYELAGGNLEITKQFGKMNADTLFKGTYKGTLESVLSSGGGVMKLLERYAAMTHTLFNLATYSFKEISEKHARFRININLDPSKVFAEPYFTQLEGTLERVVEMSGGKNVKVKIIEKQWKKAPPFTEYDIVWE